MTDLVFSAKPLLGADFVRRHFALHVPHGWTRDNALDPTALRHHSGKVGVNDLIEMLWEDGTREMWVRVVSVGPGYVALRVIMEHDNSTANLGDGRPLATSDFTLDFSPNKEHLWRIVAKATGEVMSKGHPSKADAEKALAAFLSPSQVMAA